MSQQEQQNGITEELLIRRAHLPHWQAGGSVYFVTFNSRRGPLPPQARRVVMQHILFDHRKRYELVFAVVMPDHVHLLLYPRPCGPGHWYDLADILKGLKGASARRINQLLGTKGQVWQEERYDRIMRNDQELEEKMQYIFENPVKAGLVARAEDYEFFVFPPVE
ncbi:MAG: transposase [Planctomycetes bacterium]|nr:transposase [Planctomycetota bacterium]